MNRQLHFPSLFFRQRLNATVLPMLGGIFLFLQLPAAVSLSLWLLLSAITLVFVFCREGETRKQMICILLGLILALTVLGAKAARLPSLEAHCKKTEEARGYVVEAGEGYYDLALTDLNGKSFHGRVCVLTNARWHLGEKRAVRLTLFSPYPEDRRCDGILFMANCAGQGTVIGKSLLYSSVGSVREKLFEKFSEFRNGGFLSAILLGDRTDLTDGQTAAFQKTASSHILAISGLHISQIICFVFFFMGLFPVSRGVVRFTLFPVVVVLYLFSGAGISVFRAGFMTLFSVFAQILRRRADSTTGLCFSAALLVLSNPFAVESPSFLLSYASTFGLTTCGVLLGETVRVRFNEKEINPFLKSLRFIVLSLFLAVVSFVFTIPVQLYLFRTATPLAPLYSVLLIPLFQVCLILALLGSVLLFLPVPSVSNVILKIAEAFPDFVEFLAKGAPDVVELGSVGVMVAAVFTVFLGVMFIKKVPVAEIFALYCIEFFFLAIFSLCIKIIS